MRGLWAVYKREVVLYFQSFIAYAVAFALLGIIGLLFSAQVVYSQQQALMTGQSARLTEVVLSMLSIFTFLLFLIAPLITMRLLAEESREGTLEVLMTLPMGDWAFVVAKFLAAWTLYTALLGLTLIHVGILAGVGSLSAGHIAFMYLGTWLYGGAALAIALIWSAITEDQLVAAFLGAAAVLGLSLSDALAFVIGGQENTSSIAEFIRLLGFNAHYNTILDGIVRAQDILYFVLLIVIALFITTLIISTRRWRAA